MRKVAHYRRVVWLSDEKNNLERLVREALDACPDVASTKFAYRSDIDVQISSRSLTDNGTGIYFTLFTEGRKAATIENGGEKVQKRNPPRGEEFLKTGIMLVINKNHVAYLADGHTNDGQITALFHHFFKARKFPDGTTQFLLEPKANHEQLIRLLQRGVKSIGLGLTSFGATVEQLGKKDKNSIWLAPLVAAADAVKNAMSEDRDAAEREAASEIEVSVHLGYDGRRSTHLVPELLGQLARGVEENASEFKIVTKDDAVITHDKLIIKTEVTIDGDEVASDPSSAFVVLRKAMNDWREAGVFEQ